MQKKILMVAALAAGISQSLAAATAGVVTELKPALIAEQATERYILMFNADASSSDSSLAAVGQPRISLQSMQQLSRSLQLEARTMLPQIGAISADLSAQQLKQLKKNPRIASIELDPKRYLLAEQTPYGITMVQALQVPDNLVSNRKVCILDTGYTLNHPDLINSGVTGSDGYGSNDTGNWYEDGNGHGTHVAGTIAAVGGNNQGVVGVNRSGQLGLHIVKVFNNSGNWAYGSDLIAAIQQCRDAGAHVTSMSLGGSGQSVAEKAAFDQSYAAGMLHIAAAGNSGNSSKSYPASYPNVVSVAAVDSSGNKASFSQFNDQVEIAAPGVGVNSTWRDGGYRAISGTSMATPHVAGVAALVWSHYPQCSNQQIRNALNNTAQDKGTTGRDHQFGFGIVQAKAAFDYLAQGCDGGDNPVNQAPVAKFTASVNGRTVTFANQSTDDKAVVSQLWQFGDNNSSSAAAPVHNYAADGDYRVKLTVTDQEGLTGTTELNVKIGTVQGCQGLTEWSSNKVYLANQSVSYQGVKYTAKWWTLGENPAQRSGQWDVWKNNGACR